MKKVVILSEKAQFRQKKIQGLNTDSEAVLSFAEVTHYICTWADLAAGELLTPDQR